MRPTSALPPFVIPTEVSACKELATTLSLTRSGGTTKEYREPPIANTAPFLRMPSYGGYVYMLSDATCNGLYIGVTALLATRMHEHLFGTQRSYAKRHQLTRLVFYEAHERIEYAIAREKQLKQWRRSKKNSLVQLVNPDWLDLIDDPGGDELLPSFHELPNDLDSRGLYP